MSFRGTNLGKVVYHVDAGFTKGFQKPSMPMFLIIKVSSSSAHRGITKKNALLCCWLDTRHEIFKGMFTRREGYPSKRLP